MGIDPSRATIRTEPIEGFQEAREFPVGQPIPVAPKKGWLLLLTDR